jgi:hypothetical protein
MPPTLTCDSSQVTLGSSLLYYFNYRLHRVSCVFYSYLPIMCRLSFLCLVPSFNCTWYLDPSTLILLRTTRKLVVIIQFQLISFTKPSFHSPLRTFNYENPPLVTWATSNGPSQCVLNFPRCFMNLLSYKITKSPCLKDFLFICWSW